MDQNKKILLLSAIIISVFAILKQIDSPPSPEPQRSLSIKEQIDRDVKLYGENDFYNYHGDPGNVQRKAEPEPPTNSDTRSFLYVGGSEPVFVGATRDDLREFGAYAETHDYAGGRSMLASGRLMSVESRTPILVLDREFGVVRVRILDGVHRGRDGWVPAEWVRW